ncbi:MAG: choice-of-anchor tandem repeat GloVer-containing protein [Capsulimonadaceae bacterium]
MTNGTSYYYKLAGVSSSATSTQSSEVSATPVAAPAAPSSLSAAAAQSQVVLSWTASTNASSYNVYRGTASGGESSTPVATGISGLAYTDTGLVDNGTEYYYKVKAVDAGGTSGYSPEADAIPMIAAEREPTGTLIEGADGWLYGTSGAGGVSGSGTLFKFNPVTLASSLLYGFSAVNPNNSPATNADGSDVIAGLTLGPDGNYYGTAGEGGVNGYGTLYRFAPNGTFTTLYSFGGGATSFPSGGVVFDPAGALYGTTYGFSGTQSGTVYEYNGGIMSTLLTFDATDGGSPYDSLCAGNDGNFYGTTYSGGTVSTPGIGTIFRISPAGQFSDVAEMEPATANPWAPLAQAPDGLFYGTSTGSAFGNGGAVFSVTSGGQITVLHAFDAGGDGSFPISGVIITSDGSIYGTTYEGGADDYGILWKIDPYGNYYILHSFTGTIPGDAQDSDGSGPWAGLMLASDGNLYGTTVGGGAMNAGTVFRLSPSTGAYSVLWSMSSPLPSPPDFAATVSSATSVTLSWGLVAGAESYNIYRSTASGGPFAGIGSTTAATWVDSTVTAGVTYYYDATAVVEGWNSPSTPVLSVTPGSQAAGPSPLTATPGSTTVALAWTAVTGASTYTVLQSTTSGGPYTPIVTVNAPTVTYTNTGLTNGSTYYYIAYATTGNGPTLNSNQASATPDSPGPANLTATPGNTIVSLSWGAVTPVTNYNLKRSASNTGPWVTLASPTTTTYADTSVANGNTYYYCVSAVNNSGQTANSNIASAAPVAPPGNPWDLTGTVGGTSVSLTWWPPDYATSFDVYRSTTSGSGYALVGTTPAPAPWSGVNPTYVDNTGQYATTFYYVVAGVNAGGTSTYSNQLSITTPGAPAPPIPIECGETLTGSLTSADSYSEDLTTPAYEVLYNFNSTMGGAITVTESSPDIFADVFLHNPGGSVVDQAEAAAMPGTASFTYILNGTGSYTIDATEAALAAGSYQISLACNISPQNLVANPGNTTIGLVWSGFAGATSYNVYRSLNAGAEGSTPYATGITAASFTDTGLTNRTLYFYQVTAVTSSGETARSNEASGTPVAPGQAIYQMNCGGPAVPPFAADPNAADDQWYNPVTVDTTGITNPAPAAVYQTAATGLFTFAGLVPNAFYTLRLHFVDYSALAGSVLLNVTYNGATILGQYDPAVAVNEVPDKASLVQLNVPADADGNAAINVISLSGSVPGISAIEVLSGPSVTSPPMGVFPQPGNGQIILYWENFVGDGTTYNVYRSTISGGEGSTPYLSALSGPSVTDASVINGVTYYYQVTAVDAEGESARSAEVSATPLANGAAIYRINCGGPATPPFSFDQYFVSGNSSMVTSNAINLTNVPDPAPEAVYQTASVDSYQFPDLAPNLPYTVRLHFADFQNSLPGQRVFSVTLNGVTVLTNFDVVAAAGGANTAVVEQFNTVGGLTVGLNSSPYIGPSQEFNGTFVYTGIAEINGIEVLSGNAGPSATYGLVAHPSPGLVTLTWSPVFGATTYNLYRGTAAGGEGTTPYKSALTTAGFTDTSVTDGVGYYYTVTTVNSYGSSGASNEASATPLASSFGVPVYQVNCGGPADAPFVADTDFSVFTYPQTSVTVDSINLSGVVDPAPEAVYQTANATNVDVGDWVLTYTFPDLTPSALYTVRLHFAEIVEGVLPGDRVFDVVANGVTVLSNFDISAASGGPDTAIVEQFSVPATSSGTIDLDFDAVIAGDAMVNGIEIIPGAYAPSAPIALTALAGNQQVSLYWNAGSGSGLTYNVYRGTESGGEEGGPIATGLTAPAFTNTGLTNGVTYYYQVTAVNSAGEGARSLEASATPFAPVGVGDYQINCGGPAVSPFSADAFYAGGISDGDQVTVATTGLLNPAPELVYTDMRESYSPFQYVLPGLTAGGAYTVRLHFAQVDQVVAGVDVFDVSINGTQVLSSFDIVAATGNLNTALDQQFNVSADGAGTITIVFTPISGTAGVSGIEVIAGSSQPAVPLNLTTLAGNTQATLKWAAVSGATSYNVYRGTASGGEGAVAIRTGIASPTWIDTGLTNGSTYFYQVTAVDAVGEGGRSNEAQATPIPGNGAPVYQIDCGGYGAPPYGPDEYFTGGEPPFYADWFYVIPGTVFNTALDVSPAPQAVYDTERGVEAGGSSLVYTFPNLAPGAAYTVRLHFIQYDLSPVYTFDVAINGTTVLLGFNIETAAGGVSNAVSEQFTTVATSNGAIVVSFDAGAQVAGIEVLQGPLPPSPPANVQATATSGSVYLSWNTEAIATSYNVYRATASGGEGAIPYAANVQSPWYADTSVTNGNVYYYQVTAVDQYGESARSPEVSGSPEGFLLSLTPATVTVSESAVGPTPVLAQVNGSGHFNGIVTLTLTGLPSPATGVFYPGVVTLADLVYPWSTVVPIPYSSPQGDTNLYLTAPSGTALGTYNVLVTGTSGQLTATAPLSVTIGP